MSERLTDAEIAELRKADPIGRGTVILGPGPEVVMIRHDHFLLLLNEIEQKRQTDKLAADGLIIGCPHNGEHASYCAGCCASFDPGRMVLVHAAGCRFRGHERAER